LLEHISPTKEFKANRLTFFLSLVILAVAILHLSTVELFSTKELLCYPEMGVPYICYKVITTVDFANSAFQTCSKT